MFFLLYILKFLYIQGCVHLTFCQHFLKFWCFSISPLDFLVTYFLLLFRSFLPLSSQVILNRTRIDYMFVHLLWSRWCWFLFLLWWERNTVWFIPSFVQSWLLMLICSICCEVPQDTVYIPFSFCCMWMIQVTISTKKMFVKLPTLRRYAQPLVVLFH